MIFGSVAATMAKHSIATMCRVLEVSRSGSHAWAARRPSARAVEDDRLLDIREVHRDHRGVYGSRRLHAELVLAGGERLGRKRVERLMRAASLSGLGPRRRGKTTIRGCISSPSRRFSRRMSAGRWTATCAPSWSSSQGSSVRLARQASPRRRVPRTRVRSASESSRLRTSHTGCRLIPQWRQLRCCCRRGRARTRRSSARRSRAAPRERRCPCRPRRGRRRGSHRPPGCRPR